MASAAEHLVGDAATAQRVLAESEALAPNLDSYAAAVEVVLARAIDALFEGDLPSAGDLSRWRASRQAGDRYHLQIFLMYLAQVAMLSGDVAGSEPWFLESLRVARQIDDRITHYVLLSVLSWHAASTGQMPLAARLRGRRRSSDPGPGPCRRSSPAGGTPGTSPRTRMRGQQEAARQ